ncbi:mediator complex, subunit Med20 [Dichotomocladium elegans]|nr:mediator complex, subunit Med20 [Dichotomocladium elegans]
MVVTCIVRWKNATGMRDFTYIQEHVTKSLHGRNNGPWSFGFKLYRDPAHANSSRPTSQQSLQSSLQHPQSHPHPHQQHQTSGGGSGINSSVNNGSSDAKLMYQVVLGQQPGQAYCMVDGSVVVEAEKELEIILTRLKNLWQLRHNVMIEGTSFEIGDFTLRVANILLGSTYKGLLLEISYHPCSTPNIAADLFREFVESIVPATAQLSCEYEYNYELVGLSNHDFTMAHTGYQYMMLFRNDGLL